MSHNHSLPPANQRADMIIRQGATFEWVELAVFGTKELAAPQPDISTWGATFKVWPNMDPDQTEVISLTAGAGITLGLFGIDEVVTELDAGAAKGATTVTLDSATDAAIGRHIAVWLDTGDVHITSIADLAGSVATLTVPLTGAAASANVVKHYDADWMLGNVLISRSAAVTGAYTAWGQGLYQLDFIDTFGHVIPYGTGVCCLEKGG